VEKTPSETPNAYGILNFVSWTQSRTNFERVTYIKYDLNTGLWDDCNDFSVSQQSSIWRTCLYSPSRVADFGSSSWVAASPLHWSTFMIRTKSIAKYQQFIGSWQARVPIAYPTGVIRADRATSYNYMRLVQLLMVVRSMFSVWSLFSSQLGERNCFRLIAM
jgi:hypothetical protein